MMKYILGFIFLLIGVLGIILPVIPGVPFLIIAAFFFGILSKDKVVKYMKKFKNGDKNSSINRLINYVLIRYVHKKTPLNANGKN
ncbi:hypothetical protein SAMN06265182_0047 [Persephonella hydrogeniphila]|uniref:Transmembrane protein (PGPGW) n=1 Tax=Persephonella hydrogeniphila TaxID=198703 RepID=A0A285MYB5_9AQUI|nr:DUF454 family protein [Persephonella hydrogeniphila]SNZ02199.1 hypothetical protein SAMN06265182_0047 [Persephonella hydrogeniphila]